MNKETKIFVEGLFQKHYGYKPIDKDDLLTPDDGNTAAVNTLREICDALGIIDVVKL